MAGEPSSKPGQFFGVRRVWDHLPQREEEELQAGRDGRCCSREIIVVLKPG